MTLARPCLALALGSLALVATAVPLRSAHAVTLERHPYLQTATPTSVIVVWTTRNSSVGTVQWGPAPDQLDSSASDREPHEHHEVTLTGLTPGTRYYYRVLGDDEPLAGGDLAHTFLTPPPVGSATRFRAWVVGDSGTGGAKQALVRDAMLRHVGQDPPHIYLHVGDMAYGSGTESAFTTKFFAPYADILRSTPVWPTIGNHEGSSSDSATQTGPYYEAYVLPRAGEAGGAPSGTEAYYSFDYANVHFVVLDSHESPRQPDGPMLQWLVHDLIATSQAWVIAYWHHPPYSKGTHDSDGEMQLVEMRENALPILEAGGVDLVLAGHSHTYERSYLLDGAYQTPSVQGVGVLDGRDGRVTGDGPYAKPFGLTGHQGAIYVVAGHGGTGVSQSSHHPLMFFDEAIHGSCLIDVDDNRLSLINVRYDGEVNDRVSIVKGDGIVLGAPDGGEQLVAGQTQTIRWASVGREIDAVNLVYSIDATATWVAIAGGSPTRAATSGPCPTSTPAASWCGSPMPTIRRSATGATPGSRSGPTRRSR